MIRVRNELYNVLPDNVNDRHLSVKNEFQCNDNVPNNIVSKMTRFISRKTNYMFMVKCDTYCKLLVKLFLIKP